MTPLRVLVADGDETESADIARILASVATCSRKPDLQRAVRSLTLGDTVDVALVSDRLPDATALESVTALRGAASGLPIVLITDAEGLLPELLRAGADECLARGGIQEQTLLRVLGAAVERAHIRREQREVRGPDPLTGAVDRNALVAALAENIDQGGHGALLWIELDRFSRVNEQSGSAFGDEVLKAFAAHLRQTAGSNALVARVGGDEFAVLVPHLEAEAAWAQAQRLSRGFRQPLLVEETFVRQSARTGFALPGPDPARWMRAASVACEVAHRTGLGQLVRHEAPMSEAVERRLAIEDALLGKKGLQGFALHFQPIFRLSDGQEVGKEAFLRWDYPPLGGAVPPAEFVPIAESIGATDDIGAWVLREATRVLAARRDGRIAVNVTAGRVIAGTLESQVDLALRAANAPAERLDLELTEAGLLTSSETAIASLRRLRERGIRLVLDDFGTGSSALESLTRLQVDAVKVDRVFVGRCTEDAASARIVEAVIGLAHALGLVVIGEGVETEAQLALLSAAGCDLAQGYLLGRPAPLHA